jgi:hypothetical protein
MQRNEREGGKGAGRNTERRRKGNIMDEKDMEDERKDRKKNVNFLELHVFFIFVIRNRKVRRANKAFS